MTPDPLARGIWGHAKHACSLEQVCFACHLTMNPRRQNDLVTEEEKTLR